MQQNAAAVAAAVAAEKEEEEEEKTTIQIVSSIELTFPEDLKFLNRPGSAPVSGDRTPGGARGR